MPDKLKIDYDLLHKSKADLEALAGEIGPLLSTGVFSDERDDYFYFVLGDHGLADAMSGFRGNAFNTLHSADKGLKELAAAFGSVGEAFLSFDADLTQNMGVMGQNLGLQNWRRDKDRWDYKQSHLDQCTPGKDGTVPDFCSATDPGAPPLEQTIQTEHGSIQTKLTLDENGNVIREESTVVYDGKEHKTVTNYTDGNGSYTADTTYPDKSTTHMEVHVNDDGSGTMVVTGSDGKREEFTRGPKDGSGEQQKWQPFEKDDPSGGNGGGSRPPKEPYVFEGKL
ncbi:hypothetical protein AB0D57_20045 [Streptomyces sp. NPDC048275]|uniref:hypothetical protein n=1 Tax=Streptomyces sp. NPDC048275 TaxID=3155629 RepID=UPI00340D6747